MNSLGLQNKSLGAYKNKLHFFSELATVDGPIESNRVAQKKINKRVKKVQKYLNNESIRKQKYPMLIKDYDTIRQNFNQLFALLQENKRERQFLKAELKKLNGHNKDHERKLLLSAALEKNTSEKKRLLLIQIYCLDLAFQLLIIAKSYSKSSHVTFYQDKIKEIINKKPPVTVQQKNCFNESTDKSEPSEINAFAREFFETLNLYRLSFVYSGRFWNQIASTFGIAFNTDIFIDIADFSHVLNIGLFSTRFILNGIMICKHTFCPTDAENNVSLNERFWFELKKRYWMMVNDLVWTVVHSLTNFSEYFHISNLAVHWLLMGCMIFDVLWLGFKIFISEKEYQAQEAKYLDELNDNNLSEEETQLLNAQLNYLRTCRYKQNTSLLVSLSAVTLFAIGFFLVHFITASFMNPVFCLICVIALAINLSAKQLSCCLNEQYSYNDTIDNAPNSPSDYRTAKWDDFAYTLIENLVMPSLVVALYAISWPAALLLSAGYLAYKSLHQEDQELDSVNLQLC